MHSPPGAMPHQPPATTTDRCELTSAGGLITLSEPSVSIPMHEREQSVALVAYPDVSAQDRAERMRTPVIARPVTGPIDTDALIQRAMNRFPTVRAVLAR